MDQPLALREIREWGRWWIGAIWSRCMFERLHGLYGGGICHGGRAAGIPGRHAVERGGEGGGAEGVTRLGPSCSSGWPRARIRRYAEAKNPNFDVAKESGSPISSTHRSLFMKKFLLILLTAGIAGIGTADIQSPPAYKHGMLRKLSRAVANLGFGYTEIPVQWARSEMEGGASEQVSYGTIYGAGKTVARVGYGLFELVTFPFPAYKGTYRAPYAPGIREEYHPSTGLLEFPPEVGFISGVVHNREQVQ